MMFQLNQGLKTQQQKSLKLFYTSIRCEGTVITGINLNSTTIVSTNVIAQGNVIRAPIMKQFVNNLRPKS